MCQKYDLKADASFIFGTPGETKEDIHKTFKIMRHPALKSSMVFQLTPLPSSAIWDYAEERGLINENVDWDSLHAHIGNERLPWMNKAMTWEEFLKIKPEIVQEYQRCNYRHGQLKFKWQYLLNPQLIKRFMKNWRGFSHEFVNRFKRKYFDNETKQPELENN